MLQRRIVIAIMLLVWPGLQPSATAQPSLSGEDQQKIVKLYSSGSPRALAMLTLGDGPPMPVVFDTGEDMTWLVTPYAKQLKLHVVGTGPLIDEATGRHSTVPLIHLPSPKLGGVAVSPSIPTMMIDYDEPNMVGVFGPGAFNGQLVTLELSHNRVRVGPLTPATLPPGHGSPYFHDLPAMTIDVAGIPVLAHLDSGSTLGLGLGRGLMKKLKLKSAPVVIGTAHSVSGDQDLYSAQIAGDVRIGPVVLHDPEVSFAGDGEGGNVGYDIIRQLTLVMDPAGQRSWVLDPADLSGPLDQFAGTFGERRVHVADGKLQYQREGRPSFALEYLGGDLFEIPETGDRVQFRRTGGRVTALELITADGQTLSAARTS